RGLRVHRGRRRPQHAERRPRLRIEGRLPPGLRKGLERVVTVSVAVRNVSKTFGATHALRGVDLEFASGEVHALLGSNGSGKSTLVKVLAGVESPDPGGSLSIGGEERSWRSWDADAARLAGLCFVHQYRCLFPSLSVAENIAADGPMASGPLAPIGWRQLR